MSSKIPSRLIIYRSSRFAEVRENNIKYAYFSPKFEYYDDRSSRVLQKRTSNLPKKGFINEISFYLASRQLKNKIFIRFLARLSSLQRLSLSLSLENSATQYLDLQKMKTLHKTLKVCSRAKAFDLTVYAHSLDAQFSLKFLSFTRSFKNFNYTFHGSTETHIEKLANQLMKVQNKCPNTKNSFFLIVDPEFDPERIQNELDHEYHQGLDWSSYANSIEKIHSTVKNSQLDLELCPPQIEMEDFMRFAQRFLNLSSFNHLSIYIDLSEEFLRLLNESKYLKKLSMTLHSPKDSLQTLIPDLEINTLEPKSLSELVLNLEHIEDIQYLPIIFQQLVFSNPQLSSLSLSLRRDGGIPDSILEDIIQSLEKFDRLSYLFIDAEIYPTVSGELAALTLKKFYEKLSTLKNLKELNLCLSYQLQAGSEDTFVALCKSLKSLKKLKSLDLDLASSDSTENCLIQLIPVLPDLDSLELTFNGPSSQPISASFLKQFLESLVDLKSLSCLKLEMKVENIDDKHAKEFITSFWEMKKLNSLTVYLEAIFSHPSVQRYLKQQILQLRQKFYVSVSI